MATLLFLAMVLPCPEVLAGKLDDIRDEVYSGGSDDDGDSDDDGWYDDDDDDDWNEPTTTSGTSPGAIMVLRILGFPWSLPNVLIEGNRRNHGYLIGYPYGDGSQGYMTILRHDEPELELVSHHSGPGNEVSDHVSFGLTVSYAYDLDVVHHPGIEAKLDTSFRLGLQTSWTMLLEPMSTGRLDRLTLGTVDLAIRHVQHEHVQMHTGMGLRLMVDHGQATPGFDFFYSTDVFPVRPLVISTRVELGNLGSAFLVHARGHLGITFHGVEIFAGYDVWQIGSVVMHGPTGGIRLWL